MTRRRSKIWTRVGVLVAISLFVSGTMSGLVFTSAASAASVSSPTVSTTCASLKSADLGALAPVSAAEALLCDSLEAQLGVSIPPPQPPPGATFAVLAEYAVLLFVVATALVI